MIAARALALVLLLGCSVLAQDGDRDHAAALMASGLALSTAKTPDALHRSAADYQDAAALWRKLGEPAKQLEALYDAAWPHYALGEYGEMSALLEQAMELAGPGGDPSVRANLLTGFSVLHNVQGEYAKAIEELGQARDIYRQLLDKSTELQVTSFQANAYRMQGNAQEKAKDLPAAIASHERAAALFQEAGDSERSGSVLVHLGQLSEQIGTPDAWERAAAYFTQAVPLLEAAQDRAGEANAWWGLATAADSLGQIERSRDAFLKVVPLLPDLRNVRAEGIVLKGLANAEDKLKHIPEAIGYYERALPLLADAHDVQNQYLAGMKLGMAREALGRNAEALDAYQTVAAVCQAAGSAVDEATALSRIGLLHMAARNWQAALDAFSAEQKLQKGLGDKAAEALSWNSIGSVYQNRGEYKQKLDANLRALALEEGDSDRVRQAAALLAVGDSYNALHNATEALQYLERALEMGESDPNSKASALVEMGEVYYGQSRLDEALRFENQSLAISLTLDKPAFTNRIWTDIGLASQARGERTKAREIFEKTLASARERQDTQQTYTSLHNLARLYQDFGDSQGAEKLYNESLKLAQRDGEREQEANTLSSLGMVYHALAREEEARQTLGRALSQQRALGNRNGESIVLNNLALVYSDTGQSQQALEALNQALSIMRELKDEAGVASQLRNLGTIYQGLGDYDGASSYYAQALETQKNFKDEYGQGLTHNSLGVLDLNTGNPRGAIREFEEALPIVKKYGDRAGEAIILSNMANASTDAGDLTRAAATEQEALGIARETHDLNDEALALHGLGSVYERSGDLGRALDSVRQARVMWHQLHNENAETKAWSLLARIEQKQGNTDAGLEDADESIILLESQRAGLGSEDLRAYFLASVGSPYQIRIDLLMEQQRLHPAMAYDRQAFETSERERARSLIDLLAESHADIRRGIDPDLRAQELAVERSLSSKASQMRLLSSGGADFRELQVEIEDLTAERERIEARIRGSSPAFAALTQPQPLNLSQIQKQVLDRNTTLLEYSLGEERSYLFLVTGTSFRAYELPKRVDIVRAVNDFYDEVADLRKDRTNLPTAAALSHVLLDPVAPLIRGRRLVIVGDGELSGIPFAALPEPSTGKALIIEHEIVTQPSASAIAILRRETAGRKRSPKEIAVIADPVFEARDERLNGFAPSAVPEVLTAAVRSGTRDGSDLARLTHTREEAEGILELTAPGKSLELLDFSANKAAVLGDRLSGYRIIHFATHGLIDATHPQLSGLALSLYDDKGRPVDGFLRLNDIFGMRLSAQLVVLSACESGQGKLVGAEGLMGLTRGFFFAGAESLVVSLWKVDDAATGKLMGRFYQEMLGAPRQRPAAALRAAQIWMITHSQWQDPYFWAAFALQGEWK
jgi:CHAT domain-containing protein